MDDEQNPLLDTFILHYLKNEIADVMQTPEYRQLQIDLDQLIVKLEAILQPDQLKDAMDLLREVSNAVTSQLIIAQEKGFREGTSFVLRLV